MDNEIREWLVTLDDIAVEFRGNLLAEMNYWEGLFILRTSTGKYVCRKIVPNGRDEIESLAILPNFAEIKRFFGHGLLAEALYKKARLT